MLYERVRQWQNELRANRFATDETSTQFTVDLARRLSETLADVILSYEQRPLSEAEIMAALPQAVSFMLGGALKLSRDDIDSGDIVRLVKLIGTLLIEDNETARANGKNPPETQTPK